MGSADCATVNDRGNTMTTQPAVLANHIPAVKLLLDGKFIDSRTSEWHDVVNPATQEELAQVPFSTDEEINAAAASAKQAYKTWKTTPLPTPARVRLNRQAQS